ncbi:hypothetical protein PGT21_008293 [Puccinia graminis f. sp. tritici]|uniref:Uncharacterized protein n=1 Tax=Puccinia graminis f. sp. tritici TaxID=56615 RepID=A0A5B0QEQ5_PUCGR|nr:hypothetical protein PGT21_008293 [Puccinia graminis f. sp. tritici]
MVGPHPDTRSDADIRWQFQRNCTSASAPAPASGYLSAAAGIRAGILGYPPSKGPATDWLEGFPSSRRGKCTSATGRASFQSTRYMYLGDWKGVLPVDEVQVPRRLEGNPSSRPSPLPAAGILWDTRIPASNLRKRGHPHPLAATMGLYFTDIGIVPLQYFF